VGRQWRASYEIGREKVREFARALEETNPLHHDPDAARRAGFPDVVCPPMFVAVYTLEAIESALYDPALRVVAFPVLHARQTFEWHEVVCAGQTVSTTVTLRDARTAFARDVFVFESRSTDETGAPVCSGHWSFVIRHPSPNGFVYDA
jgi:acyl dehydratase